MAGKSRRGDGDGATLSLLSYFFSPHAALGQRVQPRSSPAAATLIAVGSSIVKRDAGVHAVAERAGAMAERL
jgi:hypothetical protein